VPEEVMEKLRGLSPVRFAQLITFDE
jgi:hypothetical protein